MSHSDDAEKVSENTIDGYSARELRNLIYGYPIGSPSETLESCAAELASAPEGPGRGGWILILHATASYAASGLIGSRHVVDGLIGALEAARSGLTWPEDGCGHDRHPPVEEDRGSLASLGVQLSTPGGQAFYENDRTGESGEWIDYGPLEELLCPAYLAGMADDALTVLRDGRSELFELPYLGCLDGVFLRPDGRVDIGKMLAVPDAELTNDKRGLWAAQRWESGAGAPEDRPQR